MEPRIYHGQITPQEVAQSLLAEFNNNDYRSQQLGREDRIAVQITTQARPISGGDTALTVTIQKVEDGISIQLGKQAWLGVAASLGMTAISALRNPWMLLSRLDDLAQDIENLQLSDHVWEIIERTARSANVSFELSARLRRLVCEYCDTANPVGEPSCIACGAPLGKSQPNTCPKCGFVIRKEEANCPNCGQKLG